MSKMETVSEKTEAAQAVNAVKRLKMAKRITVFVRPGISISQNGERYNGKQGHRPNPNLVKWQRGKHCNVEGR